MRIAVRVKVVVNKLFYDEDFRSDLSECEGANNYASCTQAMCSVCSTK